MASDNTSPRAGTRTAEVADGTQPLEPVTARDASGKNGSAGASNGSASKTPSGSGGAPKSSEAPTPSVDSTTEPAGTGSSTTATVKEGAVKAAAAALAAARSAAKKVQSTASSASASAQPGATSSSTPPPPPGAAQSGPRPQMHYSAGGVSGSAQASPEEGAYASQPQPEAAAELGSPRRVRLSVSRIDPWSIMKLAFLLSVAIAIMTVVATIVAWYSLNSLEFFATVQEFMTDTLGPQAANLTQFVAFERVVSLATLIALVNIVLMTAIATIMAMLYNITAALVGGVHLTLTDE